MFRFSYYTQTFREKMEQFQSCNPILKLKENTIVPYKSRPVMIDFHLLNCFCKAAEKKNNSTLNLDKRIV